MKFTLNWLKQFVHYEGSAEDLAEILTMGGLEVESIAPLREPETDRQDWLIEVSVTPNRGDCLSVRGLAREVSALSGVPLRFIKDPARAPVTKTLAGVSVSIEDPRACARYSAKIVDGVRIAPSPSWMRFRLEACGIRAINNVVDITNYVMLETGQPLHAFDRDRIVSGKIVVRRAERALKFVTLDGFERQLAADDLLICDGERPVALAGVMGGVDSEVTSETTRIFLESANFDPVSIRRTAKRLVLHSEASHRFERSVDPEKTLMAAERAVELLSELAGGCAIAGALDEYPRRAAAQRIELREERIERLLGTHIERKQIVQILESLGLVTQEGSGRQILAVAVPSSRPDLTRESDLIEEIARVYGYQNIPTTLPPMRPSERRQDERRAWSQKVVAFLTGQGLTEVINLPFTGEALNRLFRGLWQGEAAPVAVLNPLVKEQPEMRLSLIPGLLENLQLNLAQQARSMHVFHLGKVFRMASDGGTEERQCLAGVLYGPRECIGLRLADERALEFLDCKGLVEGVLDLLRMLERVTWRRGNFPFLHPGRAAEVIVEGNALGYLGQTHPALGDELGIPPVLVFELDFDRAAQYAPRQIKARSLPRFPTVERDFALLLDQGFPSERIIHWIKDLGQPLIECVEVFDEYQGPTIPQGKKSLAYKISYRASDRTLTDGEINHLHQDLINRIGKVFDAQRR